MMEALIDTEDLEKVMSYNLHFHTKLSQFTDTYYVKAIEYPIVNGERKVNNIYMHQIVFPYDTSKNSIDHKNKNGLDNRKENLRLIDKIGNAQNRKGKNSNNTSGYRNVSFMNGTWVVRLQIDGKNTTIGVFDNVDEAGIFADEMREKYYKKYIPIVQNANVI